MELSVSILISDLYLLSTYYSPSAGRAQGPVPHQPPRPGQPLPAAGTTHSLGGDDDDNDDDDDNVTGVPQPGHQPHLD